MSAETLDWLLVAMSALVASDFIAGLVRGRLLLLDADKRQNASIYWFYLVLEFALVALIASTILAAAD